MSLLLNLLPPHPIYLQYNTIQYNMMMLYDVVDNYVDDGDDDDDDDDVDGNCADVVDSIYQTNQPHFI